MVWKKFQRPAGIAIAPWAGQENLYICTTDSHNIFVLDKAKGKIVQRIADAKILCPHSIAFSQQRSEIYITGNIIKFRMYYKTFQFIVYGVDTEDR